MDDPILEGEGGPGEEGEGGRKGGGGKGREGKGGGGREGGKGEGKREGAISFIHKEMPQTFNGNQNKNFSGVNEYVSRNS